MVKDIFIDSADFLARFFKRSAQVRLRWSRWWADCAEAIQTGSSISEIRKQREAAHD